MSSLQGDVQVIGQDAFTSSSIATANLGQLATDGLGRYFRYVQNGAVAMAPGKLYQASAEDTTNFQNLTCAVSSVGDTQITTTTTVTLTANQLAGGIITVTSATTGVGLSYRIASHPAATAAAVTFTLVDPIVTATTGTVKIDIVKNPYQGVIVNPTTASSAPVGVSVYPLTASYYGWLGVKGAFPVLADGAVTVGTNVSASNGTAGAVEPAVTAQAAIGVALTGIATTEYGFVQFNLP